jgi:hypothetical protein
MTDKARSGAIESKTFHGSNPSLKPDECCRYSIYRAFFLSAVVNRSSLRTRKERTDGGVRARYADCAKGNPGAFALPRGQRLSLRPAHTGKILGLPGTGQERRESEALL